MQSQDVAPICDRVMEDRLMSDTALHPTTAEALARQPDRLGDTELSDNDYALTSLKAHKQRGLELAVRARWIAMAATAIFLLFVYPDWAVIYYLAILGLMCLNGYFIQKVGRVGQSRQELFLIFVDLALLTFAIVCPNPFATVELPVAFQYRFDNFMYFYVILAVGTLAYSWRTVVAIGTWTTGIWMFGLLLAWWFSTPDLALQAVVYEAFEDAPRILEILDPNSFMFSFRIQEVMVFLLTAVTLGLSIRRFDVLLLSNAALARERANLSRYFSPNVVEQLSKNDDPLKQVKRQKVAILFVDIVGFTQISETKSPYAVITLLREFHARMEREVFRHNGTLDKYLGDGLMATFGTPTAGEHDAEHAVSCACAMQTAMDHWNQERTRRGEEPIEIGVGVHYGDTLLGDIGANRLEFAVIGTAVNVASRLEGLTRVLPARIVVSKDAFDQIPAGAQGSYEGFQRKDDQTVRGIREPISIYYRTSSG